MGVTIEEAGTGIKEALANIATLRRIFASNELSQTVNALPCALVVPGEINYGQDFSDDLDLSFRLIILMAPIDSRVGMDTLLPLLEKTGTNSIFAALEADPTLGGRAHDCACRKCSGIQQQPWGESTYLSVEFEIQVYA